MIGSVSEESKGARLKGALSATAALKDRGERRTDMPYEMLQRRTTRGQQTEQIAAKKRKRYAHSPSTKRVSDQGDRVLRLAGREVELCDVAQDGVHGEREGRLVLDEAMETRRSTVLKNKGGQLTKLESGGEEERTVGRSVMRACVSAESGAGSRPREAGREGRTKSNDPKTRVEQLEGVRCPPSSGVVQAWKREAEWRGRSASPPAAPTACFRARGERSKRRAGRTVDEADVLALSPSGS